MSNETTPPANPKSQQMIRWIVLTVIAGVLIFNWWSERNPRPVPREAELARPSSGEPIRKEVDLERSVPSDNPTTNSVPKDHPSVDLPQSPVPTDIANDPNVRKPTRPAPTSVKQTTPHVRGPPPTTAKSQPNDSSKTGSTPKPAVQPTMPGQPRVDGLIVHDVVIRNLDDDVVYRGTVDLTKALARIDKEQILTEFRHDGVEFKNFERRLPIKPRSHYREWVFPTSGLRGPGPQRVVTGKDGEAYYTWDHYEHFLRIRSGR